MSTLEQKEKIKDMYFNEGLGYKKIAKALDLHRSTVRTYILSYKEKIGTSVLAENGYTGQMPERKKPEKPPGRVAEERISRLEMEVDLLKNFILEIERR